MQRYHDTSTDPLPLRSAYHEEERQRIEQATKAFLAQGGQIEQIGFQMRDKYTFVINAAKSPVYAHLFEQPTAPAVTAQAGAEVEAELVELLPSEQLAARLMVQAALGASPKQAALAVVISEKQARQLARDFNITFQRQR